MILDIQTLAKSFVKKIQSEIQKKRHIPHLVIILVGNNPGSEVYVRNKMRKCESVGIKTTLLRFQTSISEKTLLTHIQKLNKKKDVHGILVQSPLPNHIHPQIIFDAIDPKKDVDGFSSVNTYALYHGKTDGLIPCTPKGVMKIVEDYFQMKNEKGKIKNYGNNAPLSRGDVALRQGGLMKIENRRGIEGKHIVVIGKSPIVGKPLSLLLMHAGATVTVCHSRTENLKEFTKIADVIIVAVGKKCLISKDMVRKGSLIIDVGINVEDEGDSRKLCGDCDTCNIAKIADITPVPGGVGPMTIAMLLENTLLAYKIQRIIKPNLLKFRK